ncbi:MAG TPA: Gfo/Idh/MocA family oxidoreductase [Bryobacteraceae bacterium]|nr:Gfo/Idh/MocA family oxidoreductase [Bryobacteraceae bacterium]
MKRRDFVTATATGTLLASGRVLGANDRIRIGLIGTGGRCMYLASLLKALPGTEFVAACDVYEPRRLAAVEKMGAPCTAVSDYRAVLDNREVDAVVVGAPDHWHTPMTLDAVAAGKDVYCEKPVTHTVAEGAKLIAGVEKSGRVVATGTQQRSWDHFILAKELLDSGRLGEITLAQCYWYQNYLGPRPPRPVHPVDRIDPAKLDWKRWLGSAPEQPFSETKYRRWRFFWDFGGGIFTDLMTHWIDVIMWFMQSPVLQSVQASGATHALHDLECPDTVNCCIQFPNNYTAVYYGTMNGSLEGGGIVFRGSQGTMKLTRDGVWVYREGKIPAEGTNMPEPDVVVRSTGDGTRANLQNWLDSIRSRKTPNANIRVAVEAANVSHLTNQAMRERRFVTA